MPHAPVNGRPVRIYLLRDPETDAVFYVGRTVQPLRSRLIGHRAKARDSRARYLSKIAAWYWAIQQRGDEPRIEEIEFVPAGENWQDREIHWIAHYRRIGRLANVTDGGDGHLGFAPSLETIEKRASKLRGRPGRKLSEEEKRIQIARLQALPPRRHTEETRQKMSAAKIGRPMPPYDHPRRRAIEVDGQAFRSIVEAERALGKSHRTLFNWLASGKARYLNLTETYLG